MFRRRSKKEAAPESAGSDNEDSSAAEEDPAAPEEPPDDHPGEGPWDVGDVPEGDDVMRVDLGGLRVPALPDIELQVETDPTGAVAAVVLAQAASTLALGAFAAPRGEGIWDDVRTELLASLRADGGDGRERVGTFGTELVATVAGPEGRQAARFVGIDGPCWFLRGVFTGPAATDPAQAGVLERALREVVVSRGGEALPVRDPLPLVLPAEVLERAAEEAAEAAEAGPAAPGVPERGPEITEIR
jgi:hypothetical protein